ncbi:DNA polymerase III subunit gamma/tau [Peptostreptococcus canis]|uniref:DNA-directed DNA polymerase n=1 Tax=Peptostreptococcus canis TaxID=1159213 RepID=A0ABR6TNB3_9FIRM|nr:DNA polymerase III subunit gamma/tau [Peptostreptococcus canis]MBC2576633.1 DNA polymerase III subunit gamma/tau [Peptostreptococcus canis]MBP1998617.1 DNA polymerase-3 subunit gamma/tau [Peptostreptococcus canis]
MHKALYREYRPVKFDDVIGQEHIIRTLKNQIKENNTSHAYLFCGTRGTGKTTTAKILSRAINCENPDGNNPCNKCKSCKSILDGSNLDVVEIDAASNNSVDDIRELRDTVKYTPSNSKYKVYIVDEVHMLSQGAFNALLKTLEEPPSYVIFILATTEPNKIPATILSRCQRFDFKRVSIQVLTDRMKFICSREDIEIDEDALRIIARNGNGSVRDSLSILDKCISFSDGKLTSKEVLDLLGAADPTQLFELGKSIIDSDMGLSMKLIDDYFVWGKDLKVLAQDLVQFFRSIMMIKISGSAEQLIDISSDFMERLIEISKNINMEEIINILNILSELLDKLKYSSDQRMSFEIYIMKLSSPSIDYDSDRLVKRIEKIEKIVEDGKINILSNTPSNITISPALEHHSVTNKNKMENNPDEDRSTDVLSKIEDDEYIEIIKSGWNKLLNQLEHDKKVPLRVFLSNYYDIKFKNGILYIIIDDDYSFSIERLMEESNFKYLNDTIRKIFNSVVELKFILKADVPDIDLGIVENKEEDNILLSTLEKKYPHMVEYEEDDKV